ncbi:cytochrome c oxidase assembly protein [Mesorhizobium delmotii]|uniref:Putative membrane protein n=1 Tax=Mesorhizobium delmotii TaxID=1631247 RepID=A0A2P9ARM2_9HYPH|nr:cytochrome c oxidase assembly protein [Mesorhizobium delmotii]SJM33763.1 putative membrane protein [Mesorhizobium delmotii]
MISKSIQRRTFTFIGFGTALLAVAIMSLVIQGASSGFFTLCLARLPAADPANLWREWSFAPAVAFPMAFATLLYVLGFRRLEFPSERPTIAERVFFTGGMLVLGVAVLSPLCRMASTLAWAHMLQHVALVAVAPPLLLLSNPGRVLSTGLSLGWGRSRARRPIRSDHFLFVSGAYGAAIWFWHVPLFYEAALLNESVHLLMYGTLLTVSFTFWKAVIDAVRAPSERSGVVAFSLFGTILHTGLLGALLTFSQAIWYPLIALRVMSWGISPLQDQQLAGLIMWVPMGMIYLAAGLAVVGSWLSALDRPNRVRG